MNGVTAILKMAASSLESGDTCSAKIYVNGGFSWTAIFKLGDGVAEAWLSGNVQPASPPGVCT